MLRQRNLLLPQLALLLGLVPIAIAAAHGDDHASNMDMGQMMPPSTPTASQASDKAPLTYFRLDMYSGWIFGHIVVMTLTWTVLLPLGKSFKK